MTAEAAARPAPRQAQGRRSSARTSTSPRATSSTSSAFDFGGGPGGSLGPPTFARSAARIEGIALRRRDRAAGREDPDDFDPEWRSGRARDLRVTRSARLDVDPVPNDTSSSPASAARTSAGVSGSAGNAATSSRRAQRPPVAQQARPRAGARARPRTGCRRGAPAAARRSGGEVPVAVERRAVARRSPAPGRRAPLRVRARPAAGRSRRGAAAGRAARCLGAAARGDLDARCGAHARRERPGAAARRAPPRRAPPPRAPASAGAGGAGHDQRRGDGSRRRGSGRRRRRARARPASIRGSVAASSRANVSVLAAISSSRRSTGVALGLHAVGVVRRVADAARTAARPRPTARSPARRSATPP